jgi:hypothetical protein
LFLQLGGLPKADRPAPGNQSPADEVRSRAAASSECQNKNGHSELPEALGDEQRGVKTAPLHVTAKLGYFDSKIKHFRLMPSGLRHVSECGFAAQLLQRQADTASNISKGESAPSRSNPVVHLCVKFQTSRREFIILPPGPLLTQILWRGNL